MDEFKSETLCILKCGGPVMMVTHVFENTNTVELMWFTTQGELKRDTLNTKYLTIIKQQEMEEGLQRNNHHG